MTIKSSKVSFSVQQTKLYGTKNLLRKNINLLTGKYYALVFYDCLNKAAWAQEYKQSNFSKFWRLNFQTRGVSRIAS